MSAVARGAATGGSGAGRSAFFYLNSWGVAFPKFRFLHVARDVRTRTIGDKLETWRATFGGHEASYRHAKPVCDLLVKASFGDLTRGHFKSERMKDGSLRVQMQGARNKVAAFLDYAGGLPAKDAHKLPVSDLISSAHLRKDRGLGPRRAAPGVGAALAALGYPPDVELLPSVYDGRDAAGRKRKPGPDEQIYDAISPTCGLGVAQGRRKPGGRAKGPKGRRRRRAPN
ncbi:hypothetical protein JL722_13937 [Aureococcus anophagefferens]|nr:hypothetical protein JL722_13937 [Aureococcus anophagefferens]